MLSKPVRKDKEVKMQYWGFRIDVNGRGYPDYYVNELGCGILRQGWGYEPSHDLQIVNDLDAPPRDQLANLRMYNEVKCGDIILIPRIPAWELVTVARATEDWNVGYDFSIDTHMADYGHKFPAEKITHFHRDNLHVRGDVRSTLRCQLRFWNMDHCAESLDEVVTRPSSALTASQDLEDRLEGLVAAVMRSANERIEEGVYRTLLEHLEGSDWEYALVVGLKAMFPDYEVERTGGAGEQEHGTDILITMPGPLRTVQYGIAIQVKDWREVADNIGDAVAQITKAEDGWKRYRPEFRIVEKIVVVTGAHIPNDKLRTAEAEGVTILASKELRKLLRRMAVAIAAKMDE